MSLVSLQSFMSLAGLAGGLPGRCSCSCSSPSVAVARRKWLPPLPRLSARARRSCGSPFSRATTSTRWPIRRPERRRSDPAGFPRPAAPQGRQPHRPEIPSLARGDPLGGGRPGRDPDRADAAPGIQGAVRPPAGRAPARHPGGPPAGPRGGGAGPRPRATPDERAEGVPRRHRSLRERGPWVRGSRPAEASGGGPPRPWRAPARMPARLPSGNPDVHPGRAFVSWRPRLRDGGPASPRRAALLPRRSRRRPR